MATELMGQVAGSDSAHSHSSPEASASGPATCTPVDAMPTVESTVLQKPNSARGTPVSRTPTPRTQDLYKSQQGHRTKVTRMGLEETRMNIFISIGLSIIIC